MNDKKKPAQYIKNKNFVPYEQLTDAPARLFREILEELDINNAKWKTYLDDYLRAMHPDDSGPAIDVKRARSTALGNIQSTLFCSRTLSFNKFLMALKILKVSEADIGITIKRESGEVITVSEKTILLRLIRDSNKE